MDNPALSSQVWQNRSTTLALVLVLLTLVIVGRELAFDVPAKMTPETLPVYSVDLNRASEAELNLLPGVGEKLARDIIHFRDEHGSFSCVDDLEKIRGIKGGRLSSLQKFVFVRR